MNILLTAPEKLASLPADLIDPLVEPTFIVTRSGIVVQVNRAALRALGRPIEHVLGRPMADFAGDGVALGDLLRVAACSTAPLPAALRLRHADGHLAPFRVYGSLLRSSVTASERLLFLRCVPHDAAGGSFQALTGRVDELNRRLHDQHKLQLHVEAARETAEEASRSKSRFLAHMSHELRTPLNAILGFAEVIERQLLGPSAAPAYATYARYIAESGRLLLSIINDMLDLSKIEAGRMELRIETIAAYDIIGRVSHLVKGFAHNVGVKLEMGDVDTDVAFQADPQITVQMLVNLLTNAIKFTPKGGTVSTVVRRGADGGVQITVADTGIGMSAEDIAKALEPFGQVDSRLSRQFRGTGLGLPLTKSLIELHAGTLSIDSTLGRGTRVTLSFPPHQPEKPAAT